MLAHHAKGCNMHLPLYGLGFTPLYTITPGVCDPFMLTAVLTHIPIHSNCSFNTDVRDTGPLMLTAVSTHNPNSQDYVPSKLHVGAAHPDPVVETASLAAVEPPDITYQLHLDDLIHDKLLSGLQLESIVYACQRHEQLLPDNSRAGMFIGDGAGVGKGRTIAGGCFATCCCSYCFLAGRCGTASAHLFCSCSKLSLALMYWYDAVCVTYFSVNGC